MSRRSRTTLYASISLAFALVVAAGIAGGEIAIDWGLIRCATRLGLNAILLRLSSDWAAVAELGESAKTSVDHRVTHDFALFPSQPG